MTTTDDQLPGGWFRPQNPHAPSWVNGQDGQAEPYQRLSKPGTDLDTELPKPLLVGRLDPIEATLLYGEGGVGKGALACEWVRRLGVGGHTVLILDYEFHEGEWGRRLKGIGADPSTYHWLPPLRSGLRSLTDPKVAEAIKTEAEYLGASYLVIDSLVMACAGNDVSDPNVPIEYAASLQAIGLPSLSLGHVTKMHDLRYPFGSVFWHNMARMSFSLSRRGYDVLLHNRKASNYRPLPTQSVTYDWWDDVLRGVSEQRAELSLMDRIGEVLTEAGTGLSTKDIADGLNDGLEKSEQTSQDTVRATLTRDLRKLGMLSVVTKSGDIWDLRSRSDGG